jgi:outer membrane protein assembly factor BamA
MGGMHLVDDLDRPASSQTSQGNWVVAPIPFRNELLGIGLVLGAGYLYGVPKTDREARHSIAAAAGMYAEGGSWTALAAHRGYWSDQRRRTTVAIATGELLYDIELQLEDSNRTLGVKQKFSGISLEAAARVGDHGWLGLGYRGGETEVLVPGLTRALPEELATGNTIEMSSVLLDGEIDTRDSDLYPRSGRYAQIEAQIARQELGSDRDYLSLELEWNSYRPIGDAHVLAWRVAGKIVDGDAPFFAMSWFGAGVDLRGYTPGRYIGESMITAQAEWRWQAAPRWGFTAFGGVGKVSGALGDIDTDPWLPAGGVGVRFRLAKALPLNLRADFAWGRDDSTFSLAIGEAF